MVYHIISDPTHLFESFETPLKSKDNTILRAEMGHQLNNELMLENWMTTESSRHYLASITNPSQDPMDG